MTQSDLDALHDAWEIYDVLLLILAGAIGFLLIAAGFFALWSNSVGVAGLLTTSGVALVAVALNKRPYQAR